MPVSVAIGTPMGVSINVVDVGVMLPERLPAPPLLQAPPVTNPQPALSPDPQSKMDLILAIDCTASMGEYIEGAKKSLLDIATRFEQQYPGRDRLRIGVVAYQDHPPQASAYVTKVNPLSSDISVARTFIGELSASGGGDGPEAVGAALGEVLQSDWRTDATKVAVLIADAPPHGIGESGDGFPQGVPDSTDPFVAIDALAAYGVRLYPVGCLPALNTYTFAIPFYVEAARKTGGKAIALSGAGRLGDVILGASVVEMGLSDLKVDAQRRVTTVAEANPLWTTHEVHIQVASDLQETGAVYRSLGGAQDLKEKTKNASHFKDVLSLEAARVKGAVAINERTADDCGDSDADDTPVYRSLSCSARTATPVYHSLSYSAHTASPVYRSVDSSDHKRVAFDVAPAPEASLVTENSITADFLGTLLAPM